MASLLRARLLGRPSFETAGKALPCATRKALWLAAYVLVTGKSHARARLASLVWGGDSPRHAQGSLRVALTKLPKPLAACLEVTRDEIAPAAAGYEIDAQLFASQCGAEDLEVQRRAIALYGGDLLQGVEEEVAPEFADWL